MAVCLIEGNLIEKAYIMLDQALKINPSYKNAYHKKNEIEKVFKIRKQ